MYIRVKDIVTKCTERSEGLRICEKCQEPDESTMIKIDFEGIVNVTDDFVFGFLGPLASNKEVINRIHYVRIQAYIKTKFKRTTKQIMAVH